MYSNTSISEVSVRRETSPLDASSPYWGAYTWKIRLCAPENVPLEREFALIKIALSVVLLYMYMIARDKQSCTCQEIISTKKIKKALHHWDLAHLVLRHIFYGLQVLLVDCLLLWILKALHASPRMTSVQSFWIWCISLLLPFELQTKMLYARLASHQACLRIFSGSTSMKISFQLES